MAFSMFTAPALHIKTPIPDWHRGFLLFFRGFSQHIRAEGGDLIGGAFYKAVFRQLGVNAALQSAVDPYTVTDMAGGYLLSSLAPKDTR